MVSIMTANSHAYLACSLAGLRFCLLGERHSDQDETESYVVLFASFMAKYVEHFVIHSLCAELMWLFGTFWLLCAYYDLFLFLQGMALCCDGNCIISVDHLWQYGVFAVLILPHMIILGPLILQ